MSTETPKSEKGGLNLQLFGTITVDRQGIPLPHPSTRKTLWLLALLVLRRDQIIHRSVLSSTLWPDSAENLAAYNLRRALSDLRRVLGPDQDRLVTPTSRSIQLDLHGMDVDLIAFDTAVHRNDAVSLNAAVALYRGPLLEECTDNWAISEREVRSQSLLHALEVLAAQARDRHDLAAEAGLLRRILLCDPYRESTLCGLMTALAVRGDYAAVTVAYREFRLRLHNELNGQPGAETTALYRRLIDPQKQPKSSAQSSEFGRIPTSDNPDTPHNLPIPMTSFVGRESEIEDVTNLLAKTRLLTLTGSGGCGKTRLALQVAQQALRHCADGVWLIELAPLMDGSLVLQTVATVLGLHEQSGKSLAKSLMECLKSKSILLVLDNCEHLLEACAQLADSLLRVCPNLKILATSREGLGISGELTYRVPSLTFPEPRQMTDAASVGAYESARLFIDRALFHKLDFELTDSNAPALASVCHRLDGIPLAIELAAARIRSLSVDEINTRLDDRFRLLIGGSKTALPRQQTLRAAIDWSYGLLTEPEKELLARLSVFTNGWTLEAAEAVCEGSFTSDQDPILIPLLRLVEKSLVLFQEHGGALRQSRYRMLEMTRQYAAERLSSAEREAAERRHAEYFLAQALERERDVERNETIGRHRLEMRPDLDNYRAAICWWHAADTDNGIRLIMALNDCGLPLTRAEIADWAQRLFTQPVPPPSLLQAKLYHFVAGLAIFPNLKPWTVLMERAYSLAEACGDDETCCRALACLAYSRSAESLEIARDYYERSLNHAKRSGNRRLIAESLTQLCRQSRSEGDLAQARWRAEELIRLGYAEDHWSALRFGMEEMALMAADAEDHGAARDYFERALAACPETESHPRTNMLRSLGRTAVKQRDFDAARAYYFQSITVCQEGGDVSHEAWTYYGLASCAYEQRNSHEAMEWLRKSVRLFDRGDEEWSLIYCLKEMAKFSHDYPEHAAYCWSAYERLADERSDRFPADRTQQIESAYATLRTQISAESLAAIRTKTALSSLREIVQIAYFTLWER